METGLETFDAASVGRFARVFEDAFDRRDFAHMAGFYANDAWLIGENTGVFKGGPAGACQTACSCPRWWLAPHYVLSEGCAGSASVEPLT
jgi:hypothetical protein